MPSMEISPELEDLIIRRLAETANRNKIIEELCLARNLPWSEAEEIVNHLIRFHHLDITWHFIFRLGDIAKYIEQFPGLFGFFVLGLLFMAAGFYGLTDFWPSIFLLKLKPSR